MPDTNSALKVLVTGANGFIAIWIVKCLLDEGSSKQLQMALSKSLLLVNYRAFDTAVQGVDAIIHTASPVSLAEEDPSGSEIIAPALKGTLGVLESALKHGDAVKRIIVTSSISTISRVSIDEGDTHRGNPQLRTFSEEDWNEGSEGLCEKLGKNAAPMDKYQGAKVAAEKAARKFAEDHKNEIAWDLVTVHPSFVFGAVEGVKGALDYFHLSASDLLYLKFPSGPKRIDRPERYDMTHWNEALYKPPCPAFFSPHSTELAICYLTAMPNTAPLGKVLVTGANGFIAIWIVKYLLDEGYSVRGTVRNEQRIAEVTQYFPEAVADGTLEIVATGELTQEGAFDTAVQGVDGIFHTASPVMWPEGDPLGKVILSFSSGTYADIPSSEIITPALKGTVGVLESALKYGESVKRIVVTASISTISRVSLDEGDTHWGNPQLRTFSEEDWNQESQGLCERLGKDAPGIDKYQGAKVTAEKAAWKFVDDHRNEIAWDLVTVHPSFVFGPPIHNWIDPKQMAATVGMWHGVVFSEERPPHLPNSSGGWVDVRDVALGHIRALQKPEASGQRFLLTAEHFTWNDFNGIANNLESTLPKLKIPIAPPRPDIIPQYWHRYNNEKARNVLGIDFRSKEECTRDTLEDWFKKGM
ncbi:hypothetical protein NP233_g4617 [Leucocoprinus birnbaumii]|uniref:NAD-dependent epimerase/dehydratase domain-containing protein n=1 Tax=Leucocoprinus birnbaumii TaxID=56174 RepID=A0AAD5W0T4_9AGAR|nr:hypothetical protein NP233_g4617 [Leucocoprinus birnbaumii]